MGGTIYFAGDGTSTLHNILYCNKDCNCCQLRCEWSNFCRSWYLLFLPTERGAGGPPPALLTYLCPGRPCFSSSDVFLFAFLSISLLASVYPVSLPLFFLFLQPCLIHARMPDWGRAFVHGHTFLHSWTHFLAFMEWADDIGSGPAAWSYVPVLLPLVLFVSFIGP